MICKLDELGPKAERGSSIVSFLVFAVIAIIVLNILVFYVFGQIVRPNEIGLRRNYFSIPGMLKEGYVDKGLLPGLHWKIPGISTVQLLPRDFQFVHLNDRERLGGDLDLDQLEIPTTDGSKVRTDITLILRYFEEPSTEAAPAAQPEGADESKVPFVTYQQRPHGGPKDLVNSFGSTQTGQLRIFATKAEESVKKALSKLTTTDYYNPVVRERAALKAREIVNDDVAPDGIELWATLIRRYVYSEKNIDDQIFAKNLQEQTERLNAAERALQEAKAETEETKARWDAEIKDLLVEGQQRRDVIMSEADRYEVEQVSIGDRMVEESIAKVDQAKNTVLTDTPGAEVYIARQMAPLLTTLEGGVVTDIDPYDVDSWVKKLVSEVNAGK